MVRLVAVDTDGTLLDPDGHIPVHNTHVIRCMQNAGVELLVCMGRSYADALPPLGEAGLKAAVACMNGASVYNQKGRLVHKQELVWPQVEHILECCRNEDVIFGFMTGRRSCTTAGEEEFREYFECDIFPPMTRYFYENTRRRFTPISSSELLYRGSEFYKISVIHESHQVLEQVKERLKIMEDLAVASSFITNLELTHIEVQKGKALAAYAPTKNIWLGQVMAIGDSENDYFMFSMNLKYTVAMESATERTKNTTKCQTRTSARDEVTYTIESLVLYKEANRA